MFITECGMNQSHSPEIPVPSMNSDPGATSHDKNVAESISPGCSTESVQLKKQSTDTSITHRDEDVHVRVSHAEAEFVAIEIQTVSRACENKGGFDQEERTPTPSEDDGKICRVCHLSLSESGDLEDGVENSSRRMEAIELGCGCKDDLAHAHRRCAETWFKIKGNRTCEICGKVVQNVAPGMEETGSCGRRSDEQSEFLFSLEHTGGEEPSFWHHRPICNVVLAFIVIILLLPWLFRVRLF